VGLVRKGSGAGLIALRRAMNALRLLAFSRPEGMIIGTGRCNTVGTGFIIIIIIPPTSLREEASAAAPYSHLFREVPHACQVNSTSSCSEPLVVTLPCIRPHTSRMLAWPGGSKSRRCKEGRLARSLLCSAYCELLVP
jgi:hypothetical protein